MYLPSRKKQRFMNKLLIVFLIGSCLTHAFSQIPIKSTPLILYADGKEIVIENDTKIKKEDFAGKKVELRNTMGHDKFQIIVKPKSGDGGLYELSKTNVNQFFARVLPKLSSGSKIVILFRWQNQNQNPEKNPSYSFTIE